MRPFFAHAVLVAVAGTTCFSAQEQDERLIAAARAGDLPGLQQSLQDGANINAADAKKWTPLIHALEFGRTEAALALLKAGAAPDAKTRAGDSALAFAAWRGNSAAVSALLERGADAHDSQVLWVAFTGGEPEVLKLLISHGVDPKRSVRGSTGLIAASVRGHGAMVDLLLQSGADVEARDEHGSTALMAAAIKGHAKIARTLLARGAKLNVSGFCGRTGCPGHTPLSHAAGIGDVEMLKLFLEGGADPAALDHAAAREADENGHADALKLLRNLGAGTKSTASVSPSPRDVRSDVTAALTQPKPFAATAGGVKGRTVRLAIIADAENLPAAEVLAAALSDLGGLALVERTEINRVLTEHELLRHAADHSGYAELGGLLHANALLFIRTRTFSGKTVTETRVVNAELGIVLDSIFNKAPLDDPDTWAKSLHARLLGILPKLSLPPADAVAISIVNLRASIDSPSARETEKALTALLAHRLVQEPHFFVLERGEMERLLLEKELGKSAADFLGAGWLVAGSIEAGLGNAEEVALKIALRPARSGAPLAIELKGRRAHLAELAEALVQKINQALAKKTSSAPWQPLEEAGEYFQEAEWAQTLGAYEIARSAAEASWALGLRSPALARIRVLSNAADARANPGLNALPMAIHTLESYSEGLHLLREDAAELGRWLELKQEAFTAATLPLVMITTASDEIAHEEEIATLRRLLQGVSDEVLSAFADNPAAPAAVDFLCFKAMQARWWYDSELAPALRKILGLHFAKNDGVIRARLRQQIASACAGYSLKGEYKRVGRPRAGWLALAADLSDDAAPEDQLLGLLLNFFLARAEREKRSAAAKFVELLPRIAELAGAEPESRRHYAAILGTLSGDLWARNNLPLFREDEVTEGGRLFIKLTPESLALYAMVAGEESKYGWAGRKNAPSASAGGKLITRFWHPFGLHLAPDRSPETFRFKDSTVTWAEEKIWCYGEFEDEESEPSKYDGFIFQIDPVTLKTETISLPPLTRIDDRTTLAISPHYIVLCRARSYLARYDRTSKKWVIFNEIKPAVERLPLIADDCLYVEFENGANRGVVRVDHRSGTAELLVSNRRKPPLSPADDAALAVGSIQLSAAGELAVAMSKPAGTQGRRTAADTFIFQPRDKSWRKPGDSFSAIASSGDTPMRHASRAPRYDFKIAADERVLHGIRLWDGTLAERLEKHPPFLMYPLPIGSVYPCDGDLGGFWLDP